MDKPNTDLRPGKGGSFVATAEVLAFFHDALEAIFDAYGGSDDPNGGDAALDAGNAKDILTWVTGSSTGWTKVSDNYGTKIFRHYAFGTGEYRVTLLVDSRGVLKLDIRNWFDPSEAV